VLKSYCQRAESFCTSSVESDGWFRICVSRTTLAGLVRLNPRCYQNLDAFSYPLVKWTVKLTHYQIFVRNIDFRYLATSSSIQDQNE